MAAAKENVIIAYDGSAAARQAIDLAGKLLGNCRVLVVTVWEAGLAYIQPASSPDPMMMGTTAPPVDPAIARTVDDQQHGHADQVARDGANLARSMGLDAEPVSVPDARNIAHTIVDLARERDAAAIFVGSRGLSGLRARLEGSTSKGLLAHAHCPVVVVHESD